LKLCHINLSGPAFLRHRRYRVTPKLRQVRGSSRPSLKRLDRWVIFLN